MQQSFQTYIDYELLSVVWSGVFRGRWRRQTLLSHVPGDQLVRGDRPDIELEIKPD